MNPIAFSTDANPNVTKNEIRKAFEILLEAATASESDSLVFVAQLKPPSELLPFLEREGLDAFRISEGGLSNSMVSLLSLLKAIESFPIILETRGADPRQIEVFKHYAKIAHDLAEDLWNWK